MVRTPDDGGVRRGVRIHTGGCGLTIDREGGGGHPDGDGSDRFWRRAVFAGGAGAVAGKGKVVIFWIGDHVRRAGDQIVRAEPVTGARRSTEPVARDRPGERDRVALFDGVGTCGKRGGAGAGTDSGGAGTSVGRTIRLIGAGGAGGRAGEARSCVGDGERSGLLADGCVCF